MVSAVCSPVSNSRSYDRGLAMRVPRGGADVENALRSPPAGLIICLGERDELLGHTLSLLCLCVGGLDVLILHELRDQAAQ